LKDKLFNSSYLSKDFQKYAQYALHVSKILSHTQSIFQHVSMVATITTTPITTTADNNHEDFNGLIILK
jgi:hypothetical protein